MARKVSVNVAHSGISCKTAQIRTLYRFLDKSAAPDAIPAGELSIAIVDEAEIVRMHKEFLNDPAVTDVITFPGDEEDDLAGEICVCADFAARQAPLFDNDFDHELTLYLVHGWLHLAGYDDIEDEDRLAMRAAEKRTMALLTEGGILPHFTFSRS